MNVPAITRPVRLLPSTKPQIREGRMIAPLVGHRSDTDRIQVLRLELRFLKMRKERISLWGFFSWFFLVKSIKITSL